MERNTVFTLDRLFRSGRSNAVKQRCGSGFLIVHNVPVCQDTQRLLASLSMS